MFALISDDQLYLKADVTTVPDFEAEGLGPFTYEMKIGTRSLPSYWQAPEWLLAIIQAQQAQEQDRKQGKDSQGHQPAKLFDNGGKDEI